MLAALKGIERLLIFLVFVLMIPGVKCTGDFLFITKAALIRSSLCSK